MGIRKNSITYLDVVRIEPPFTTADVMFAVRRFVEAGRQFSFVVIDGVAELSAPQIQRAVEPTQPTGPSTGPADAPQLAAAA